MAIRTFTDFFYFYFIIPKHYVKELTFMAQSVIGGLVSESQSIFKEKGQRFNKVNKREMRHFVVSFETAPKSPKFLLKLGF